MKQKEILILTGRFGMGHSCVAEAIRQQLVQKNSDMQVRVVDFMDALFPNGSAWIYGSFAQMVNHCPSVYNRLNKLAGRCNTLPMQSWIADKMKELLDGVEIVVSTFPICAQFAAIYKQKYQTALKIYTYITDIGAQDEWIVSGTDLYFVGAEETKLELMAKGVSEQNIHVCGIPVRQNFLDSADRSQERTEILFMGGGLGLIPSMDDCLSVLSRCETAHVTIITGKNQALYHKLRAQYPSITAVGFTDQVAQYMRQADLLVTKSGGATTFEAIYSETPLYILQPFLMQEFANARYIERHQLGCVAWKKTQMTAQEILALAQDTQQLRAMKQNMRQLKQSWEEICPAAVYDLRREQAVS